MKHLLNLICLLLMISWVHSQDRGTAEDLEYIRNLKEKLQQSGLCPASEDPVALKHENGIKSLMDYGDPPDWNWVEHFGGSGQDNIMDIISDPEGNVYICGSFSGEISVGDSSFQSNGNRDAFVAKFKDDSELIWIKQFPSSAGSRAQINGMYLDELGKIYFTGYFSGTVTLGSFILTTGDDRTFLFGWLDHYGNVLRAKMHTGSGNEVGSVLDMDGAGNIYILGYQGGESNWYYYPSFILKYDEDGALIDEFYNPSNFWGMKISGQSIYFTGTVDHYGYIGGFILETPRSDVFIAKSDLNFNFEWVHMAERWESNNGYSYCNAMYVTPEGNIYVGGYYYGDIKFGNDVLEGYGLYVGKAGPDGEIQWLSDEAHIYSNAHLYDICVHDNSVYFPYQTGDYRVLDHGICRLDTSGFFIDKTHFDYQVPCIHYCSSESKLYAFQERDQLIRFSQLNPNLTTGWNIDFQGNSAFADLTGMGTDHMGDLYVYGYASNNIEYFGENIQKGLFLAKQEPSGDVVWIKNFLNGFERYDYGNYIVLDTVNYFVYITGNFFQPFTVPGGETLIPGTEGSTFILKYDFQGEHIWSVTEDFEGTKLCLTTDRSGNVLLSGVFVDTIMIGNNQFIPAGAIDFFIAKYNSLGVLNWAARAGGDEDTDYECFISTDAADNIYFTGEIYGTTATVNNYPLTMEEGDGNIVIAKMNPYGSVLWCKVKGGSLDPGTDYYSWPSGIHTDDEGYSYIKGWHGDGTYFDEFVLINPYYYFGKFIGKFDPEGNTVWVKSIQETRYGIDKNQFAIDREGNVYLGAQANDTLYFGNDFTYYPAGFSDLYLAKYSNSGQLQWVKVMQGSANGGSNYLNSVSVFTPTCIYTGGIFNEYLNFNNQAILSSSNTHGFFSLIGQPTWISVYNNDSDHDLFDLYPNPNKGEFSIILKERPSPNVSITITDIQGKTMEKFLFENMSDEQIIHLNRPADGIYLIKYTDGDKYEVEKVIVR